MQIDKPCDGPAAREAHEVDGPAEWCIETDTQYNVIARRNALMALWAGSKMGLEGPAMSHYASILHLSDYQVAGDADIVGKVCSDLASHGLAMDEADVRRKLWEFHKEALRQSSATD